MSSSVGKVVGGILLVCVGALVAGLLVYYIHPDCSSGSSTKDQAREAKCFMTKDAASQTIAVAGTLKLFQNTSKGDVIITGTLTGLPIGHHGFHIHEFGTMSANCTAAGAHYNPDNHVHGAPNATTRHVGDLGNLVSTGDNTEVQVKDNVISLWGDKSVLGRSVVVHANVDDLGLGNSTFSNSTGNAGGRLACCNIVLVPIDN